jgi:hypothetical protein
MILYSSFNDITLLHSTLANFSTHRGREWGTVAAVVRLRPALQWFIVYYRSTCVLCVSVRKARIHQHDAVLTFGLLLMSSLLYDKVVWTDYWDGLRMSIRRNSPNEILCRIPHEQ